MVRRIFDILLAGLALVVTSPLWPLAALAIKISSPGPVFYPATRIGKGGQPFQMLKFRTMTCGTAGQSAITAPGDLRVFPAGRLLRLLKIDELPQLLNILRGEMAIVGPRPESPGIVADHYSPWMRETLSVKPGLTSIGSLFGYAYDDELIDPARPEQSYVERMLPAKLALERAYLDKSSLAGDIATIVRTGLAILTVPLGIRLGPNAAEMKAALRWTPLSTYPAAMRDMMARTGKPS